MVVTIKIQLTINGKCYATVPSSTMTRKSVNYDPELGQSDPIIWQVCRKLTKFLVTFDPERSMTQMDPCPGRDIIFPTAVPDPQYILPIRL